MEITYIELSWGRLELLWCRMADYRGVWFRSLYQVRMPGDHLPAFIGGGI